MWPWETMGETVLRQIGPWGYNWGDKLDTNLSLADKFRSQIWGKWLWVNRCRRQVSHRLVPGETNWEDIFTSSCPSRDTFEGTNSRYNCTWEGNAKANHDKINRFGKKLHLIVPQGTNFGRQIEQLYTTWEHLLYNRKHINDNSGSKCVRPRFYICWVSFQM